MASDHETREAYDAALAEGLADAKAAIRFHYDGYGYNPDRCYAAVNVKVYAGRWDTPIPHKLDGERVHPAFTWDWIDALPDDVRDGCWQAAIEEGWEHLQDDAQNVYGSAAQVYSQGRSGGWAVVYPNGKRGITREAVDGWDASEVAQFRQWASWARATADDTPFRFFWQLYENVFKPTQARAARQIATRPRVGRGWADVN